MQLNVDKSASAVAKISMSVDAKEFRAEYERGLRAASRDMRMKGFRAGKLPLKVVERAVGQRVRGDLIGHFINRAYQQAVREHELRPLAHPRVPEEALVENEDGSIAAEFEVPLRPKITLPEYTGLTLESELEPVMDVEVDAALDRLRESQATPEPAGEAGLGERSVAVADVAFLREGETVFERERVRLTPNSTPPGVEEADFRAALIGATEGAVLEIPMTLPNYIEDEAARGSQGICRVTVHEAMNLVLPADEALCALLEVADLEALRAKVRENLEEAHRAREEQRIESALLDQVLERTEVELPEPIVAQQTEARLAQLDQRLAEQGISEEDRAAQRESQRDTEQRSAIKGLKALLVVEAIGLEEKLLVSRDEIDAELERIAARNDAALDEVRGFYEENGRDQQLGIELLERKVRRFLRERADVRTPA